MKLLRKLMCWWGWHECDLWLFEIPAMFEKIQKERDRGWAAWHKVSYDEFGLAYYLECKHCGRKL